MNLLPNKIPKKVYSLIGEFIVQFNVMDFKFKHFLSSFIEDELIGYLIASNQSFDFTKKRVNSIYAQLIEDKELKERWSALQAEISELANIETILLIQ